MLNVYTEQCRPKIALTYLKNHMSKLHEIFCNVSYKGLLPVCGRRHVSPIAANGTESKTTLCLIEFYSIVSYRITFLPKIIKIVRC